MRLAVEVYVLGAPVTTSRAVAWREKLERISRNLGNVSLVPVLVLEAPVSEFAFDENRSPLLDAEQFDSFGELAEKNDVVPGGKLFLFAVGVAVSLRGRHAKGRRGPVVSLADNGVLANVPDNHNLIKIGHLRPLLFEVIDSEAAPVFHGEFGINFHSGLAEVPHDLG